MRDLWLRGGPADQLDQAQDDQQQYDEHDDEKHSGLAPEGEYQGGLSVRDVEAALAEALGEQAAISKSTARV